MSPLLLFIDGIIFSHDFSVMVKNTLGIEIFQA